MNERLKYYLAFNSGLKVMQAEGNSVSEIGEFFSGKTLEHLPRDPDNGPVRGKNE